MTSDELQRLGLALKEAVRDGEHPSGIGIIRLLLFTGCRRDQLLTLHWSFVDFELELLTAARFETGAKVIRLGAPAIDLLSGPPRFANPFVFRLLGAPIRGRTERTRIGRPFRRD